MCCPTAHAHGEQAGLPTPTRYKMCDRFTPSHVPATLRGMAAPLFLLEEKGSERLTNLPRSHNREGCSFLCPALPLQVWVRIQTWNSDLHQERTITL